MNEQVVHRLKPGEKPEKEPELHSGKEFKVVKNEAGEVAAYQVKHHDVILTGKPLPEGHGNSLALWLSNGTAKLISVREPKGRELGYVGAKIGIRLDDEPAPIHWEDLDKIEAWVLIQRRLKMLRETNRKPELANAPSNVWIPKSVKLEYYRQLQALVDGKANI